MSSLCYKQPGPPPPTAACYICLEPSTINQPLRRNCACRGDAGWAHVACLAEFAASKVTEAEAQPKEDYPNNLAAFWGKCILCKTPYMQYMGVAMAEAFVKQYEHLPDTNQLRVSSLYSLALSKSNAGNYDGALELYVRLLKLYDVLTSKGFDVRIQESHVYGKMGQVLSVDQRKFNEAKTKFEQQRELLVAVYGPNSPELQNNNDALIMLNEILGIRGCGHQKGDSAAELVVARQTFKKCREETTEPAMRLMFYGALIKALGKDGRHQEVMELFEKLIAESRQILGPDHPNTQDYENNASNYRQKMNKEVWAVIDCEQQPAISGQRVQVLRATKDAQKYICLIKNDKGVSSKFKVTQNQFILETGTIVVVHGVVSSADLNGNIGIIHSFDKEKRLYAVGVGKKKIAVSIKPINLNVVFN